MRLQPLFGGAIQCVIGDTFLDASEIRQIPDNQEVFVDIRTQQSIIFELLEPVEATDESIARLHFQQLASDNEATEAHIASIERVEPQTVTPRLPPQTTVVHILKGWQKVAKFNEASAQNMVEIMLIVVRLVNVSTDFVISVNAPVIVDPASSERAASGGQVATIEQIGSEIVEMLNHLEVNDWSLFG
ncbi:hypothetical protein VTP01DRAFT_3486 [Rhizomucor pusillus]|uniref:uncharacterized protein n=1 Tax=Rhizomucor pusillus TaxID=4840 RepID=UPI0037435872